MAATNSNKTDLKVSKFLFESGNCDVLKAKRTDGMTPVHFAASNNDVHLMDFILEKAHSAKYAANLPNKDGWTPTHMASFLNNFDALNLLLENGGDPTKENNNGLNSFQELVRADNDVLLECVWPYAKNLKRDLSKARSYGLLHLAAG